MKLGELLHNVHIVESNADLELEIAGVSYDSRQAKPGDLFVAMEGYETDGHKYIPMAREKGPPWPRWARTGSEIPPHP